MTNRYVALGSSMAAGPGILPGAPGAPAAAGRSARNYPHLVARELGLDLVDVTFSGATTAHVLTASQLGEPPQLEALDGTESLVTITVGGNDVGYVPMLMAAGLPGWLRSLPPLRALADRDARDAALAEVGEGLRAVGTAVRQRCPRATVLFVDYLTLLPPAGEPAPPLAEDLADLGRHVAAALAAETAAAAAATGCGLVSAAAASVEHHAWSALPWTAGAGCLLAMWTPMPFHPNAAGMATVAELVVTEAKAARWAAGAERVR